MMSNLSCLLLSVLLLSIRGKSFHWESYMVLLFQFQSSSAFSAVWKGHNALCFFEIVLDFTRASV